MFTCAVMSTRVSQLPSQHMVRDFGDEAGLENFVFDEIVLGHRTSHTGSWWSSGCNFRPDSFLMSQRMVGTAEAWRPGISRKLARADRSCFLLLVCETSQTADSQSPNVLDPGNDLNGNQCHAVI